MPANYQVFGNREIFKNTPSFHYLEDTVLDNILRILFINNFTHELDSSVGHFPFFRFQQAGYRFQGGGFTGPIGTQQGDNLSLGNLKGHPFQNQDDLVIDHFNVVDAKHFTHGHKLRGDECYVVAGNRSRTAIPAPG